MGLVLERREIIEFFEEKGFSDGNDLVIWAVVNEAPALYGATGNQYYILVFNSKGVFGLPVTAQGKLSGDVIAEEVLDISFKKSFLGAYKLSLKLESGEVKFRVNKVMIGYKGQKEDLEKILEKYNQ